MTDEQKRAKVIAGLEWMAESYIGLVSNISKDAIVLLSSEASAQEPVEPTWRRGLAFCSSCGRQFCHGFKYCPDCGRPVKWT